MTYDPGLLTGMAEIIQHSYLCNGVMDLAERLVNYVKNQGWTPPTPIPEKAAQMGDNNNQTECLKPFESDEDEPELHGVLFGHSTQGGCEQYRIPCGPILQRRNWNPDGLEMIAKHMRWVERQAQAKAAKDGVSEAQLIKAIGNIRIKYDTADMSKTSAELIKLVREHDAALAAQREGRA